MNDRRHGTGDRRSDPDVPPIPIHMGDVIIGFSDNGGRRRDAATRMLFDDIRRGVFLPKKMQLTHPDQAYQYGFTEGVRAVLRRRLPTPAAIEGEP